MLCLAYGRGLYFLDASVSEKIPGNRLESAIHGRDRCAGEDCAPQLSCERMGTAGWSDELLLVECTLVRTPRKLRRMHSAW